jgi:hypothetical protein
MKRALWRATHTAVFLGAFGSLGAQGTRVYCRTGPTDATLTYVLAKARQTATDPDPVFQLARDSIWKINRLTAADVAPVTDEQVCQQVMAAYDADVPSDGVVRERSLVVIRLGSDYLAVDPTQKFGQWLTGIVLNSAFQRKSWGRFGV